MGTLKLNNKAAVNENEQVKGIGDAVEETNETTKEQVTADESIQEVELCGIAKQDEGFVEEFKNLRTANETVYRRNDRTCRKIITSAPTRYCDANGEYKEISNRLIDNGTEIVNEENSFKIKFNKDTHSGKIFDVKKGGNLLSLSAANSAKTRGHVCGCKCELCAGADNIVTATLDDGTEIQYVTLNDRIKENIIVKERQESYEYNFTLNIGNLTVKEGKHNDLLLLDAETGKTEFTIPAPFMYDANKKRSNKVSYEIDVNGEVLNIKVVADADFINSEDCALPVTIDPQIVFSGEDNGITFGSRAQYFDDNESIDEYMGVLEAYDRSYGGRCEGFVRYKAPTYIREGKIVKIKLVLTCYEGYGIINVGGTTVEPEDDKYIDVEVDITNTESGEIKITPSSKVYSEVLFESNGQYAPRFVIEYVEREITNSQVVLTAEDEVLSYYSTYDSGSGGESDEYPGELTIDKAHNWFSETNAYIYINKDKFPELKGKYTKAVLQIRAKDGAKGNFVFYYDTLYHPEFIKAESKIYEFDITDLLFKDDKKSFYLSARNGENQGFSSEVEFYNKGLHMPKLILDYSGTLVEPGGNDYEGVLEEPNLKEFAIGDRATGYLNINDGVLSTTFNSFEKLDLAVPLQITNIHRVGTGSGQYGLNWRLNLNKKLSYSTNDNLTNTVFLYIDEFGDCYTFKETYYYVENGVKKEISKNSVKIDSLGNLTYNDSQVYKKQSCNGYVLIPEINDFKDAEYIEQRMQEQIQLEETVRSYEASLSAYVLFNTETADISKIHGDITKDNFKTFIAHAKRSSKLILITQSEVFQLKSIIACGGNDAEEQKNYICAQARKNIDNVNNAFIRYIQKDNELQLLKKQMPVNYLKDKNGLVSGFNEYGDLVCIFDSYGNYVSIEYDGDRIIGLSDSADNFVSFDYENGQLSSITDNRGRTVTYSYDGNKLKTVTYPDGTTLTFKFSSNRVNTIVSSDGIQGKASYTNLKLTRIQINGLTPSTENISDTAITFDDTGTCISDGIGNSERYTFYDSGRIKTCVVKDNKVKNVKTEYSYEFDKNKQTTTVTTDLETKKKTTNILILDDVNSPISETEDWQSVSDTVKVKFVTQYNYDDGGQLLNKTVRKYVDNSGTISSKANVENYKYNAKGSLILTESYVEGEEDTKGINYEERVYDKNGNVTKTVSWNSLDSSTKFYSERALSEKGQVTADVDETGEITAEYEYVDGTDKVNAVKYANGSKFAYGRNPFNDRVTSITQSTDEGEANTTDIVYKNGLPVQVKSGSTVIDYEYDSKRRKSQVSVNGVVYSTYKYGKYSINEDKNQVDYGYEQQTLQLDGSAITAKKTKTGTFDFAGYPVKVTEQLKIGSDTLYSKEFNERGLLTKIKEHVTNREHTYTYDDYDRLIKVAYKIGNGTLNQNFNYNSYGELVLKTFSGLVTQSYTYVYKDTAARELDYIEFGSYKFKPLTDVNGRNTGKEIYNGESKIAAEYISYRKVGDHATNMPATVWFGSGKNIKDSVKYKYDKCGNICEITESGHIAAKYRYDGLNRLVREDNKQIGKTVLYSYDTNGNITERCEYDYTSKSGEELSELDCTHYSYDYEGDRLVSYNGEEFAYNSIGNPTIYRGKTVQWQYGTRLVKLGNTTFAYDGLGRRIKKGNVDFVYDNDGRLISQSNWLEFFYDANGVAGFVYGGKQYFYRKDAQGNVIAILDNTGAVVVRYIYDAWGNHAIVDANGEDVTEGITGIAGIGILNPFRYRGYYYDTETGLYYLQTRYYDPETGRFISQDSLEYADPETINGLNLYAYCLNNPVMGYDPNGTINLKKVRDWFSTITGALNTVGVIMSAGALLVAVCQGRWNEIVEDAANGCFNPLNMDESVALNSNVFSFYKGEFVIRHSIQDASSCQIFGTIFLNADKYDNDDGIQTLRHEFGHGIQERLIGLNYIPTIAIPSLITYFKGLYGSPYYSMPWERTADYFGGVTRSFTYKDHSLGWSFAELVGGPIVIPFYFMFGF